MTQTRISSVYDNKIIAGFIHVGSVQREIEQDGKSVTTIEDKFKATEDHSCDMLVFESKQVQGEDSSFVIKAYIGEQEHSYKLEPGVVLALFSSISLEQSHNFVFSKMLHRLVLDMHTSEVIH